MIDFHLIKAICFSSSVYLRLKTELESDDCRTLIAKVESDFGTRFFKVPEDGESGFVFELSRNFSMPITQICSIGCVSEDTRLFNAGVCVALSDSPVPLLMKSGFILSARKPDCVQRLLKRLFYNIEDDEVVNRFDR